MNRKIIYLAGIAAALGIALIVAALVGSASPANAGLRCQYIVEKTQANRSIQQANLNSAASAGYKLAQQTAAQTVLVKCQ